MSEAYLEGMKTLHCVFACCRKKRSEAYLEGMKTKLGGLVFFFLMGKSEAYLEGMKTNILTGMKSVPYMVRSLPRRNENGFRIYVLSNFHHVRSLPRRNENESNISGYPSSFAWSEAYLEGMKTSIVDSLGLYSCPVRSLPRRNENYAS